MWEYSLFWNEYRFTGSFKNNAECLEFYPASYHDAIFNNCSITEKPGNWHWYNNDNNISGLQILLRFSQFSMHCFFFLFVCLFVLSLWVYFICPWKKIHPMYLSEWFIRCYCYGVQYCSILNYHTDYHSPLCFSSIMCFYLPPEAKTF